jgi:hypothetical protein
LENDTQATENVVWMDGIEKLLFQKQKHFHFIKKNIVQDYQILTSNEK